MSMTKRQMELERAKKRLMLRVEIERMKTRIDGDKQKLAVKRQDLRDFNKF